MVCVSGRAFLRGSFHEVTILVESGKIRSIEKADRGNCINADLILPGFIDLHVHMRGLDQRYKGDWKSESLAALRGGVTLVVDMPNNIPRINSPENLQKKLEEAKRESYIDFLFYTAYPYLPDLDYVVGIKLFPEDLRSNLRPVFQRASKLGKEVVIHAEDPIILDEAEEPEKPEEHWKAHPEIAEELAVKRMLRLAELSGTRVRIAHATLPSTIQQVNEAKSRGIDATAEVTPHHILLSIDDALKLGPLAKVNPPLRSRDMVDRLRSMINHGLVDFLVTDHAPHSREEKERPYNQMPPGIPWLDIMAPLLVTLVENRTLSPDVIDRYSYYPAKHLGINRGSLTVGCTADLVLLDKEEWVIRGEDMSTKAKSSAFEGFKVKWRVKKVFVRGELIYDGGPVVSPGYGLPAIEKSCSQL
ncbi:MAG: dihydroorotase family protein [Candidatus Korarchaeota archaeon]|nr:dihydroorotase family protein [Candidatus Korarchaeota archaeon]